MTSSWRRWSDIRGKRLIIGLLGAPIPISAMLVLIYLGDPKPRDFVILLIFAWFMLVEGFYLLLARIRRRVSAAGCVVSGGIAFATLPLIVVAYRAILAPEFLATLDTLPAADGFLAELVKLWNLPHATFFPAICIGVGFFTGWLFWRIGVRSAPEPLPDDPTDVFD